MRQAHSTTYYHVPDTASPLVEIIDHDDERVTVSYDGSSTVILFFNDASTLSVLIDELRTARDELIQWRYIDEPEEAEPEDLNMQPSVHSR